MEFVQDKMIDFVFWGAKELRMIVCNECENEQRAICERWKSIEYDYKENYSKKYSNCLPWKIVEELMTEGFKRVFPANMCGVRDEKQVKNLEKKVKDYVNKLCLVN